MSQAEGDLYDLVRQLRVELDWASRTGIIVEPVQPPAAPTAALSDAALTRTAAPRSEPRSDARPESRPSSPGSAQSAPPPAASRPATPVAPRAQGSEPSQGAPLWRSKFDPAAVRMDPEGRRRSEESLVQLGERPGLAEIRAILGDCTRCKLHGLGRTQIVFGVGSASAEIMFVGEGPGGEEDRLGEPFVGPAGQLLTKIIEAGMGIPRKDVYIANVLKCRPPSNRDPEPDEVEQCEPFLRAQIRAIQPKVIVALGKHAAHALLKSAAPISRLRGHWAAYEGVPLMPTFHPAYLLRNPADKRLVWEDMKEVLRKLGRPVPEKGASG